MNWINKLVNRLCKDMPEFAPMVYSITDESGIASTFLVSQDPLEGARDYIRMKVFIKGWSPLCRVEISQDGEVLDIATIEDIFN